MIVNHDGGLVQRREQCPQAFLTFAESGDGDRRRYHVIRPPCRSGAATFRNRWTATPIALPGFPECNYCSYPCGDVEGDALVDLNGFATFATCFALDFPVLDCDAVEFACSDMSGDGMVDLHDFATFAVLFATVPTSTIPNCLP